MKKLVTSLAILLVTAAFASYSNAQCVGCSQGVAPSFAQPVYAVQSVGTPIYNSAPVFNSAPIYNSAPTYGSGSAVSSIPAPISYSEPVYSEPVYSSPIVSAPVESFPVAAPVYSEPLSYPIAASVESYPSSVGSCCGGVVSGAIVGQPIYDSYPAPLPVGTFLDGGTVIGETVVVSTPTTGSTESVSPPTPVAQGQGSPTPEESKEPKKEPKKKAKKKGAKKKAPKEDDGT